MRSVILTLGLVVAVGCTVENTDNGNGGGGAGSGNSGGTASGGQSNTGGAAGGTAGSGGGAGTASGGATSNNGCLALCAHTNSATSKETNCVGAQAVLKGYDWPNDPVCPVIANEVDCQICAVNTSMTSSDCASIEQSCFGGGTGGTGSGGTGSGGTGSGGTGSGGTGSGGTGSGGTGGGGTVTTCGGLCNNAPTATSAQKTCVQTQAFLKGYDWSSEPICAASDTKPGCNACATKLNMKNADCAAIYKSCF